MTEPVVKSAGFMPFRKEFESEAFCFIGLE